MSMKIKSLLPSLIFLNSSFAAVFVLSDNLDPSGDGTPGPSPLVEGAGVYNVSSGTAGNPSFYNALVVGASYGDVGNGIWRSVISFDVSALDLSSLPAPTPGFAYAVTDVTIQLEQSDNRPAATINFFEGSQPTGAVVDYLATQNYAANQAGQFQSTSLGATSLDLSVDSTFTVTLDAPNASSGEYHTFGSGLAPNNDGITGTNNASLGPELTITYELVQVPEPTSITLISLGLLGLITRRKR